MSTSAAAIFLDRDGVLLEDRGVLVSSAGLHILPGVPGALTKLKQAGFRLIVVSNQAAVARGLLSERELKELHREMERLLEKAGAPALDAVYFCPHHPEATLDRYRVACDCRKPNPGMILLASIEHNLNLPASYMVGDRMSDVVAGARAGCHSVLVRTGRHADPAIVAAEPLDPRIRPDQECADLEQAAEWILRGNHDSGAFMKALVLCAGLGTRLGEMTRSIPKPMLPAGGRPLLEYTLANLASHGFVDILINLHFMPEAITDYFGDGSSRGVRLTYVYEPQLLGTAGSLANVAPTLASQGSFLVHYGDVVTDQNFSAMLRFHREQQAEATLLIHQRAKSNSVLVLDEQRRIERFIERPTDAERLAAASPWVFSGVMICEPSLVEHIAADVASDLPRDVFARLAGEGRLSGFALTGSRIAVDSAERWREAEAAIRTGTLRSHVPPTSSMP